MLVNSIPVGTTTAVQIIVSSPTLIVDATADTLLDDGRTKRETTRTYTHTSKTPSAVTTTTYTQYTYTYSDGTTNVAKGPQTTTNNTTYTTTISTEEKIISTTYIAPAVDEEKKEDPVEEEKKEDPVEEEKNDTPTIESVTTFKDNKVWSHVEKTFGPETTTTQDIISYSGSTKTTTRRTTTCKIEYHEHFDKVDTITRGPISCLQDNFFNFFRMASTTLRLVDYDFQRFQDRFDYSSDYWLVDHDLKKFPRCARLV